MLESLIQEQKDLDLIPKVVTGLLAHRKAGRWLNTQENTFALLALDLYFQTYEKVDAGLRRARVARQRLRRRPRVQGPHDRLLRRSTIPMKDVATHDKQDLTIQKDGKGRLYYRDRHDLRAGDPQARRPPTTASSSSARYEARRRSEGRHARRQTATWHIKAGARVRVKLTMVNENRRYHVALVDPMPAGLEAMNPALAVTGPIPTDPNEQKARGAYWWWYGPWYEHQNMRDERVEAFASLLWEGVHTYELRRARDDARQLRRAAAEGRGDVHARDVRPRRAAIA